MAQLVRGEERLLAVDPLEGDHRHLRRNAVDPHGGALRGHHDRREAITRGVGAGGVGGLGEDGHGDGEREDQE